MNRMLLDFSDDELSECSDCSIDGEEWDTESTSTSTDSFYRHDLLGEELFTIWELETYASSEPEDDDYSLGSGDDDIASIESLENNMMVLDQHQAIEPHPQQQQEGNDQVVVNLPSDLLLKEASPYNNNDDGSIDSSASMEERWHVDEHGQAKKSSFQDASWKRDAKRREIQRKMRNLEQRIMVIRSIAATSNPPTTTTITNKKTERASRPGRRRDTERKGRRRQRPRSLSPERVVDRSASPPRSIVFNDSLENRRRQVALARQKLQERLGRDSSKDVSAATTKRTSLTNPRHLHRQNMKRMNPNRIPSRCRTA